MAHDYFTIMAYNMRVIRALWKGIKGYYGENIVRDNEHYTNSFYASLERSRESVRQIESCALTTENRKIIDAWAQRVDKKTGISFEYLEGRERIKLSDGFEKKFYPRYVTYTEMCEYINKWRLKAKKSSIGYAKAKVQAVSKEEIQDVINKKEFTPEDRENFERYIKNANIALKAIKEFEDALSEEVERIKNLDMGQLLERDKKLYRLVYYLKTGKQSEAINIVTKEDIIRVMERTKMEQLEKLGRGELKRYIEALERQLILAKAVYIESEK